MWQINLRILLWRNSDDGGLLFPLLSTQQSNIGIWKGYNEDGTNEGIIVRSNDSEIVGARDGEKAE